MKVEVIRTTKTKELVEIDLPYFYRHDLDLVDVDCAIYGKIGERWHTSVKVYTDSFIGSRRFTVEKEPTDWDRLSCYLNDEYKSKAIEYENAKQQAIQAAQYA